MDILYLAQVLPDICLSELAQKNINYVVAPQKFHRSLLAGFISNGHRVKVISQLPSELVYRASVIEDGIEYCFCSRTRTLFAHIPGMANAVTQVAYTILNGEFTPQAILCDSLNVTLCLGARQIRRRLRIPMVAIVTDIMGISSYEGQTVKERIAAWLSNRNLAKFDRYVFLTKQMNDRINKKNRPFIVMEGVCPAQDKYYNKDSQNTISKKVFYAGGRPSKDGVDLLIAAFKLIGGNYKLNIYGLTPDHEIGPDKDDSRIIYHGVVNNSEIVEGEYKSDLLVNPRPINEEYTKYSFPSKLMEYMNTGTAVVTTRLPGVPTEYYDYVYTFDEVSVDCYKETLERLLATDTSVLNAKGKSAQEFVKKNKNNVVQTQRIIELIEQYSYGSKG